MTVTSEAATLLRRVAKGELAGQDALRIIENKLAQKVDWKTAPLSDAYHLLQHFTADEDIRERDPAYAKRQRKALEKMAERLTP